jgi:hypothetical protein
MSKASVYRVGQIIKQKNRHLFAKKFIPSLIISVSLFGAIGLTNVFGATNPSVSIDQCANGGVGSTPERCATKPPLANSNYQSGNVNSTKAHWQEGEVLPYRAVLTNLNPGVNTVTFSFDTAKSSESKHAIDYLASYDYTETTGAAAGNHANQNNPCEDVIPTCNPSTPVTAPISVPDAFTTAYPAACANGTFTGTALTGQFIKAWSSNPTGVSAMSLSYPDSPIVPSTGDCTAKFKITFTVAEGTSTVVLAWGGHVSANSDWGPGNAIPTGSPYHMHAGFPQESPEGTFFQVGNQDLQLASSAIVPPTTLTVNKVCLPANDTGKFNLRIDNATAGTGTDASCGGTTGAVTVTAGSHTVSELAGTATNLSDYTAVITGDCAANGSITLAAGDNKVCTITNTRKGHIIVDKITVPSGSSQSFAFTTTGSNYSGFSLTDAAAPNNQTVVPGNYSVAETAVTGWNSNGGVCSDGSPASAIVVSPGETVTCTFTNTLQQAHLTLVKTVTNDNGGTALPTDWTLTASGPNSISGITGSGSVTNAAVNFGAYTLSENGGPSGYTGSTYSCVNNGGQAVISNTINLAPSDNATCTVNNNDNAPSLTLVKVVTNDNGGTAQPSAWTLTAAGPTGFNGVGPSVPNGASFDAGSYDLSEAGPAGYAASSWVCVGGTQNDGDTITVGLGQSATCTITNDDIAPQLTLVKTVTNNNGGSALPTDWTLSANGPTPISGATGNGAVTSATVSAGSYALSEGNGPSGYTASTYSCVKNGGAPVVSNSITLGLSDTATCTINNNDNAPSLILNKIVINDNGGSAAESAWTLNAAGPTPLSGPGAAGNTDVVSGAAFSAGTYALSESGGLAGYSASDWTCVGGNQNGSNITVALGETATCTITNNDIQPKLTLTKVVVNDNGGSAVVSDFPLFVNATGVTSGAQNGFNAGSYSASETNLPGYTAGSWTGDCAANGSITLAPGDVKACTITNDDQQAFITVVKQVTNDNGGSAQPNDFSLTLAGNAVSSSVAVPVNPGTYTAGETNLPGYSFEGFSGDCDQNGATTVALGESKTCTLTNNDNQSYVIINKTVVNDNGGTAAPNDFLLTVDGNAASDEVAVPVNPGAHTAGETNLPGYAAGAWGGDCNASAIVNVALGETKTCTITNNDNPGTLKIVKNTTGGDGQFNFIVTGPSASTPSITTNGGTGSVGPNNVNAGTYSVAETVPSGWTLNSGICDDGTSTFAVSTVSNIQISLGENVTCTFNNTKKGHIVVDKVTNPSGDSQSFDFTAGGSGYSNFSLTDAAAPNDQEVLPGSYSVSEAAVNGWDSNGGVCDNNQTPGNVVVAPGQTITCTFTNTKRGHLIVQKTTVPAADPTSFSIVASGSGSISSGGNGTVSDATDKNYEVTPGTYSVAETVPTGWDKTGDTCQNVVVAAGQTATCLLTNIKRANLTIVKDAQPNDLIDFSFNGGSLGTFLLDDDAGVADIGQNGDVDQPQSKAFTNILPTSYSVSETMPNFFWAFGGVSCVLTGTATPYASTTNGNGVNVTLQPGTNVTCTFVNIKQSPTRTQGFWQNHTAYTTSVFNAHPGMFVGVNVVVGANTHKGILTNTGQLFGAYFSNIAKQSNGKTQRDATDKARMVLLQQLVTAKLNCAAFGCTASVQAMITAADAAYSSGNTSAMTASTSALDAYNNSGDTITIGNAGKATPADSKTIANLAFWDQP